MLQDTQTSSTTPCSDTKMKLHPVAEMTVRTTYQKDSGKSYMIVSQTGSEIIQKLVLDTILDNEKHLNEPGIREGAWITSENYGMKLEPRRNSTPGRTGTVSF